MRILDVRHEQTAAFAAEATGKLTRVPGPRRAHRRAGCDQRHQRDRAGAVRRARRWSSSAAAPRRTAGAAAASRSSTSRRSSPPITKGARTIPTAAEVADGFDEAFRLAGSSHRGPVFVDVPMDEFFNTGDRRRCPDGSRAARRRARHRRRRPDRPAARRRRAAGADPRHRRLGRRRRAGGARARRGRRHPRDHQRDGPRRGPRRPPAAGDQGARQGAEHAPTSSSSSARPLDFRLGYGVFGGKEGADAGSRRPRRRLPRPGLAARRRWPTRSPATCPRSSRGLAAALDAHATARSWKAWVEDLQATVQRGRGPRRGAAHGRGRPDPPGPHLRRAAPPAGRRRRRDRRRRRLRQLRRQVRRAAAARRLARPRALRLPRRRPRLGDRRPARPPVGAGRAAARRRRRRLLADGRRHAGPPRPAGGDGDGQQLRLGAGEGPDADDLRLRRRRRPRRSRPLRRGGPGARWRRGDGHRPARRSDRPSTAPSPRTRRTWST